MRKEIPLLKVLFLFLDFIFFLIALILFLFLRLRADWFLQFKYHFLSFVLIFPIFEILLFSFGLFNFYLLNLRLIFNRTFHFLIFSFLLSIVYFYFTQTIFKISPKTNLLIFLFFFSFLILISRVIFFKFFNRKKTVYFWGRENLKNKLKTDLTGNPLFDFKEDGNLDFVLKGGNFERNNFIFIIDPIYNISDSEKINYIINSNFQVFDFIDFYEMFFGRIPLEAISFDWLIRQGFFEKTNFYFYFKRMFDILMALLIFVFVFIPLFLPISLLIFLNDPGPIFFKQERLGYKRKIFKLIKFRTMRQDKNSEGKWFVGDEKNRIFFVGKFLRKTHLDELPQIFNLFKGDISLVGPRPEQPSIAFNLEEEIPFYFLRYFMPAGITGWAQVNYKYPENVEETKIKLEYDLYYIKNYNLSLDLIVIIKTLQKIFS